MEEIGIVIVGGGIAGLATSLALHRFVVLKINCSICTFIFVCVYNKVCKYRKGIKSVVLERAEKVRSEGAGIGTLTNGWRALDQLGVSDRLRLTSNLIHK